MKSYTVDLKAFPLLLSHLLERLSREMPYATLLDAPLCEVGKGHRWGLAGYGASLECERLDIVNRHVYHNSEPQGHSICSAEDLNQTLSKWLASQQSVSLEAHIPYALPSASGIFALLSYEAAWLWEDKLSTLSLNTLPKTAHATHRFIAYPQHMVLDYEASTLYVFASSEAEHQRIAETLERIQNSFPPTSSFENKIFTPFQADWLHAYQASFNSHTFSEAVEVLKHAIEVGDLYQANLSIQWKRRIQTLDPWQVFHAMTCRNPSPFAGLWKSPQGWVLSNSPERLVKQKDYELSTRPIAGTRSRGSSPEAQAQREKDLLTLEKERAEHLMLVDLERNDLGKVCIAGSVEVDELMSLERYSHVTHTVSNIQGKQSPQRTQMEILQALFPGGTITGCPKLRCMTYLERLEPTERHYYTGSMGYIDPHAQRMDFNILIRTLTLAPETAMPWHSIANPQAYTVFLQAGAGIVQDSVASYEFKESIKKAKALFEVLNACI
jgi:para-aminobenzoate synthetase component 1